MDDNALARALDAAPWAVAITDAAGVIRHVNAAFTALTGYPASEAVGGSMKLLDSGQQDRAFYRDMWDTILSGRSWRGRLVNRRKDGTLYTEEQTIEPVGGTDGEPVRFVAYKREIGAAVQPELQDLRARFRRIVDGSEAGYFRIGPDGTYQDVNAAWLRMHGFSGPEEILGRHFSVVQAPEDRQRAADIVASLLNGRSVSGEFTRLRKDGSIAYHSFSASPVVEGGTVAGLEGFLIDSTERVEAEQKRRASEERYRVLFDTMNEGVAIHALVCGEDGRPSNYRLLDVNRHYEAIAGKTKEEVAGRLATEAYGTEYAPYLAEYAEVVRSGRPHFFETYFAPMDKHFAISAAPMGGALFATIFFDITAQKKAEALVRASEARFRLLVENQGEGIGILDPEGCFVFANPAADEIFGVGPGGLVGRCLGEFLTAGRPEPQHRRTEAWGPGTRSSYDIEIKRPDGEVRAVLLTATGQHDENGQTPGTFNVFRDITERRAMEQSLRLTQFTIDNSPDPAYWVGPDGKILYVNEAACRHLGYPREELLALSIFDFDAELSAGKWREGWTRLRQAGDMVVQTHHRRNDGSLAPVEINIAWLEFEGREYSCSFVRDISERKRAEEELRRQREEYQVIIDSAPGPIMYLDRSHRVIKANAAAARALGYPLEALVGSTLGELFPEDLARRYMADSDEVIASGRPKTGIVEPYSTRDGEIRWAHVDKAPYRNQEGEVCGVITIATDITERKRTEEALEKRDAQLCRAHRLAAMGTWESDFRSGAVEWGAEIYEMFGVSPGEPMTRDSFVDLVHPEDRDKVRTAAEATAATGAPYTLEHRIVRPDGSERWIRQRAEAVRDAQGGIVGMSGTSQDITEYRRLEERFQQAQKLESVGRLAGGIAHDFNNLLTVINGYADLILTGLRQEDPLTAQIAEMRQAGERAADLTRQLLAFSRKQVFEPKMLDLHGLVSSTESMLRRLVGEEIELRIERGPEPAVVQADPGQLHQILMNMVVNAKDAMPSGGRITIRTATVEIGSTGRTDEPAMAPGRYVLLSIADNGAGMDEATRAHIFEPFFTTKAKGRGTGLGLSTVYGIVKQSGGWIWVYSEPEKGTTFKVYLPAQSAASPLEAPAGDRSTAPKGGSETILVVEDQDEVRHLTAAMLTRFGYRVLLAANGGEALVTAERFAAPIDLMVTDVVMPGMSGPDLAQRLQAMRPGMRVLFVSGYTDSEIAHRGVLNPGVQYLAKPFSAQALDAKIRETLEAPSGRHTILIVDDEPSVRSVLRKMLESAGHNVIEADDGVAAERLVRERRIDLVITDLVMPEREGLELIRLFREQHPKLKIVAMSGAFAGQFLRTAELMGACQAIAKPVRPERLLAVVKELLS